MEQILKTMKEDVEYQMIQLVSSKDTVCEYSNINQFVKKLRAQTVQRSVTLLPIEKPKLKDDQSLHKRIKQI